MNHTPLNRRDFLKLLSLLPAAYTLPPEQTLSKQDASQPNFIILVFDAWSANNMSLYGYPRQTTPFLEKLADRAIVYHNHYAGGSWTYPGTSSLLTGVLPWRHRGYSQVLSILKEYHQRNLFGLFDTHYRSAYTHNHKADALLIDMIAELDGYEPRKDLLLNSDFFLSSLFWRDYDIASVAWIRAMNNADDGYSNSLFLSHLNQSLNARLIDKYKEEYPLGLTGVDGENYFLLDTAIDWIYVQAAAMQQPFLGYYHLFPPHDPYHTRSEFFEKFKNDDYVPVAKPKHPFTLGYTEDETRKNRQKYDEFILFVDAEINRLFTMLDENNLTDNTWVIITSDHGELFERGVLGHLTATFNDPLVHIPLMIFPPGQQERIDITTPTSAIDIVPTLLHLSGKPIANWLEGELLPPFNPNPQPDRQIFSMDARYLNTNRGPISKGTVMLRQGDYKLTYIFTDEDDDRLGEKPLFELFNLAEDPEELNNLTEKDPALFQKLFDIMKTQMDYNGAL